MINELHVIVLCLLYVTSKCQFGRENSCEMAGGKTVKPTPMPLPEICWARNHRQCFLGVGVKQALLKGWIMVPEIAKPFRNSPD